METGKTEEEQEHNTKVGDTRQGKQGEQTTSGLIQAAQEVPVGTDGVAEGQAGPAHDELQQVTAGTSASGEMEWTCCSLVLPLSSSQNPGHYLRNKQK